MGSGRGKWKRKTKNNRHRRMVGSFFLNIYKRSEAADRQKSVIHDTRLYKHNKPSAPPFSCVFLPSFLPSSTQTTKQLKVDFKYLFPFVILCSLPTFVPLSFLVFITFFFIHHFLPLDIFFVSPSPSVPLFHPFSWSKSRASVPNRSFYLSSLFFPLQQLADT